MDDERQRALLIDTDRRRLVQAAARLLGPADAEDAVQDAYLRGLEAEALALDVAQAWLLTVVRHLAVDRLRRRQWLQRWLTAEANAVGADSASPSAETEAALAEQATRALRLLAEHLSPPEGAALLLHEVFGVGHAELARAGGRTDAGSRQQLRRALLRLHEGRGASERRHRHDDEPAVETVWHLYRQALQLRDPQALWALLRQPTTLALAGESAAAGKAAAPVPHATACSVVQVGGQLGLVLTLDGVMLCTVPLGVRGVWNRESAPELAAEGALR